MSEIKQNTEIKIIEFGPIKIKDEITNTIRVRMLVGDREFVRLWSYPYKEVWREENVTGFCEGDKHIELEAIFKAWCLENKQDPENPPVKMIEQ